MMIQTLYASILLATWPNVAMVCQAIRTARVGQTANSSVTQDAAARQEVRTPLRGTVVDHTGAIVPNFAVEIRSLPSADSTPQNTVPGSSLKLQTNHEGEFFASLSSGSYEVCVPRFPKSCRRIVVEVPPQPLDYLRLEIHPLDDHASSELLDMHLRRLAGPNAVDCGHVERKDNPKRATHCALRAYKGRKAFYVRYDEEISDVVGSAGAHGFAGDMSGKVYSVEFDTLALSNEHLPQGATMPDGFHTIIIPCSEPVRLRASRSTGGLSCRVDGRWLTAGY